MALYAVLVESLKAWVSQRAASKGAALAFYALFSMTPILLLGIVLAGYFFGGEAAQGGIVAQMEGMVGRNGAQAIQALLASTRDADSGLVAIVVGAMLLVVGAASVFVELKGSLDEMWGVDPNRKSGFGLFMRTQMKSFAIVMFLALLLLVSLLASAALALLERYAGGEWMSSAVILAPVATAVSFSVIVCFFAVIYKVLPDAPLSWRDVWTGALFTALLFSIGKFAIGLYLGRSAVASGFGAAGSIVVLLLWVYYSAQIFFLGAEFTKQYALRCGSLRPPDPPEPQPPLGNAQTPL